MENDTTDLKQLQTCKLSEETYQKWKPLPHSSPESSSLVAASPCSPPYCGRGRWPLLTSLLRTGPLALRDASFPVQWGKEGLAIRTLQS